MNSILKSQDGKDLVITCNCGCGDTIHFTVDPTDRDNIFCTTYMSGNWYREQDDSIFGVLRRKCKKIWRIIRNKDHHYSDICMNEADFETFKEYINSIEIEE